MNWANPLYDLICPVATKKKHAGVRVPPLSPNLPPFQWTSDHQESLEKLKEALTSAPVLAYPDYSKPFVIETDASLKAQICWLSDLALFDFDIRYHVGKMNQAAEALSQWPINPKLSSESSDEEEEWEIISYEMVCQILDHHLSSTKIPYQVKYEVQSNIVDVEGANISAGLKSANVINSQFNGVKLFSTILPKQMVEYQKKG